MQLFELVRKTDTSSSLEQIIRAKLSPTRSYTIDEDSGIMEDDYDAEPVYSGPIVKWIEETDANESVVDSEGGSPYVCA